MTLFEIEFFPNDSLLIKGSRKPTIKEAEEFCKDYMEIYKLEKVTSVNEIPHNDAKRNYDESCVMEWPVFEGGVREKGGK